MKTYNVAVAGALGLVGSTMVKILEEYDFPVNNLRLLEAKTMVGAPVQFSVRGRSFLFWKESSKPTRGKYSITYAGGENHLVQRLTHGQLCARAAANIAFRKGRFVFFMQSLTAVVPHRVGLCRWFLGCLPGPSA